MRTTTSNDDGVVKKLREIPQAINDLDTTMNWLGREIDELVKYLIEVGAMVMWDQSCASPASGDMPETAIAARIVMIKDRAQGLAEVVAQIRSSVQV